jgi:hypothetical protein
MSRAGPGATSLAVAPGNVGDAWVLAIHLESTWATISSVTGGGTTWRRIVGPFADNLSFPRGDNELWGGVITTTGPSVITVAGTSSLAGVNTFLDAQEFSTGQGASTKWAVDGTSWGARNNAWSPAVRFPTLAPSAGSVDLYFGYAWVANAGSAGTTTGFSYRLDGSANVVTYNSAVSGAVSPVAAQSPPGPSVSMGILVKAL